MKYYCPVCGYSSLPYPPSDYHICPCCGTEFGNDDEDFSHAQLREMWIGQGAHWFFGNAPHYWNAWTQLINVGFGAYVPMFVSNVRLQADVTIAPATIQLGPLTYELSPYQAQAA